MITNLWDRLKLLRAAARVIRCHTTPTIHRQSVGEHTFGALSILMMIEPNAEAAVYRALLKHDVTEAITGDVPTTAKWAYDGIEPALREAELRLMKDYDLDEPLTDRERSLVKFADLMELTLFCLEEYEIGNRKMLNMAKRALAAIEHRGIEGVTTLSLWMFMKVKSEVERRGPVEDLFYDQIIRDSLARK